MKTSTAACAMVATIVLSLSACATSNAQLARVPAPAASARTIETDSAYVAKVEAVARRHGITVNWVNPPSKRRAARTR